MSDDFGTDVACLDDLDPTGRLVTGAELMAQRIYRRITTPRGWVYGAPNYGRDVREELSDDVADAEIAAIPSQLRNELLDEERIESVDITQTWDPLTGKLTLGINGHAATGPFDLVMAASSVSAELLSSS